MPKLRWDSTINAGHVLSMVTLLLTIAVIIHRAEVQFAAMDKRVTVLETLLAEYLPVIKDTQRRVDGSGANGGSR